MPGVVGATVPPGPGWHRGPDSLVEAFPAIDGAAPGIQGDHQPRQRRAAPGPTARSAASPAVDRDFVHAVYGNFPYVLAFVLVLTLVLLDAGVPLDRAADQGGDPQPRLARRGVRDHRLHLPGGPRLVALEHHGDAGDHRLDPADDLRVPVRPLDGLRGLHAHADAGGVRRDAAPRTRRSSSASRAPASS